MSNEIKTAIRSVLQALKSEMANGKMGHEERRLTEEAVKAAEKIPGLGQRPRRSE